MVNPPPTPSAPARTARTDRALTRLHALIVGALGCFALYAAGAAGGVPTLLWVSGGLWLLVAVDLVLRGERRVHLVILMASLAVGSWAQEGLVNGALPPGLAVGIFGLSAARLLSFRPFAVALAAAAAVSVGVTAVVEIESLATTVDDAVLSVSMAFAIRGLLVTVLAAADRLDGADRELAVARQAEARTTAEREASERAARALHDEVLTALRGIEAGWSESTVRRDARAAVDAVRRATTLQLAEQDSQRLPIGLDSYLRSATEGSPVAIDLVVSGDPRRGEVSTEEADALGRATGELLRNAERHGGVRRVDLRLDLRAEALEIRVVDHGTGEPQALAPGFGLRSSVIAPLEQVGAAVSFERTEGGGVTAVITLPRKAPERTDRLARAYRATMSSSLVESPVAVLVLPIAAAYSYIAARNSWAWTSAWTSLLLLAGFSAVLGLIVRRLRVLSPTGSWLALIGTCLVGLTALGLAAAPDGAMLDFRGWPVGYAAVIVSLILLVVPVDVGLALLAPLPALVVVAQRLDPGLSNGAAPWSAVNAALMLPLGMLAVGALLRRVGRRVEADQQAAARLWLEDAGRRAAAWVADVHLAHTRRTVLPWIESVADGSVPLADSATLATAKVLAWEVRDDLFAPGFFNEELRRAVSTFRRRGGEVRIRPGAGHADPRVGAVLRDVVDRSVEPRRITVAFDAPSHGSDDTETTWRLVVVPPAEVLEGLEDVHRVESDLDRTVIQPRGAAHV